MRVPMPRPPRGGLLPALLGCILLVASCGEGGGGAGSGTPLEESPGFEAHQRGLELARKGRLPGAAREHRAAVELDPYVVDFHLKLAGVLFRMNRFGEAKEALEEALIFHPDHAGVALNLGMAYTRLGQYEYAASELRRATELDGENASAYYWLGRTLYERSVVFLGSAGVDQGKLAAAIEAFERAVELEPETAQHHYWAGVAHDRGHDYAKALEHFEATILADPEHVDAHRQVGMIHVREGRLEEGEKALRRALELDPEDHESHFELGLLLEERKEFEEAGAAFERVLALRPGTAKAYFHLSNVLERLGQTEAAQSMRGAFETWTEAEQQLTARRLEALASPDDPLAHYRYALALKAFYQPDEAMISLQRAIELQPAMPGPYLTAGQILAQREELPAARQFLEKALELLPESPMVLRELGKVLCRLGEWESARETFGALLALDEEDSDAHCQLGMVAIANQDMEGAMEHMQKAVELDGANVLALFNLGGLYFQAGDVEAAKSRYRSVLELEPGHDKARKFLEALEKGEDG